MSWCDTSQVTSLVSYAIADRRQPLNPLRIWRCPHSLSWCDTSQVTSLVSYAIADRRQPLNPLRIWRCPHSFWFPDLSSCTPSQVTYIDNVSSLVPCHYERSNNRFNASTRRKPNLARCWNPFRSRRWYPFSRS